MGDCLVTTLKGVVNDDNIDHMGDIHITFSKNATGTATTKFDIKAEKPFSVVVVGDGNILNSDGQPLGKTHTYASNDIEVIYLDENVNEVILRAGYGIQRISVMSYEPQKTKGVILSKDIGRQHKITILILDNYSSLNLQGSLSDLSALTGFTSFSLTDQAKVTGDLSDLKSATSLTFIRFSRCPNVGGDVSVLAGAKSLEVLQIASSSGLFYGDLSAVSATTIFLGKEDVFTWIRGRDTSLRIPLMAGVNLGSYVDAALINLASCQNWNPSSGTKAIGMIGTRTSASDEAVSTLQSMGWTVTVSEA